MLDNYQDLRWKSRPISQRSHMATADRAKQFAPFAALKGFDDAIDESGMIYLPRQVLSEEAKEKLDQTLTLLRHRLAADIHDEITLLRFVPSLQDPSMGNYESLCGNLQWIDLFSRCLELDDTVISLDSVDALRVTQDFIPE